MMRRFIISNAVRAVVCLLAVVFLNLPPSSVHAAHMVNAADAAQAHVMPQAARHDEMVHSDAAHLCHLSEDLTDGTPGADDATQNADQCCSGSCSLVFMQLEQGEKPQQSGDGHDPLPLLRMVSGGATHFLRPPNV